MVSGFRYIKINSLRIRNSRTRRIVESWNVVFIKTTPLLFPPSRRPSPLQGLQAPPFDFGDDTLDENYTSTHDRIHDVEDCASALDAHSNDTI